MSEEEKIVYWKDIRRQAYLQDLKWRIKEFPKKALEAGKKTIEWGKENPELAAALIGGAVYTGKTTEKLIKRADAKKREKLYYDHSLQQHVKLNRKLTKAEQAYAKERHDNGEQYYNIYKSMGVM